MGASRMKLDVGAEKVYDELENGNWKIENGAEQREKLTTELADGATERTEKRCCASRASEPTLKDQGWGTLKFNC
jgi:hypothetical protein